MVRVVCEQPETNLVRSLSVRCNICNQAPEQTRAIFIAPIPQVPPSHFPGCWNCEHRDTVQWAMGSPLQSKYLIQFLAAPKEFHNSGCSQNQTRWLIVISYCPLKGLQFSLCETKKILRSSSCINSTNLTKTESRKLN